MSLPASGSTDHYFHPAQNAGVQSMNFLLHTPLNAGDLIPALDVKKTENIPSDSLRGSVCKWLTIVENVYKTAPVIYTNASFYNRYLKGHFDDYLLWIAH